MSTLELRTIQGIKATLFGHAGISAEDRVQLDDELARYIERQLNEAVLDDAYDALLDMAGFLDGMPTDIVERKGDYLAEAYADRPAN